MSGIAYRIWDDGELMTQGGPRHRDSAHRILTMSCGLVPERASDLLDKAGEPGDLAFVWAGITVEAVEGP